MNKQLSVLAGMGVGAALMYMLDPAGGRRRRKMAIDQAGAIGRDAAWGFRRMARNASGAVHEARHALDRGTVPDDVLVQRIRTALGRVTSDPDGIHVFAREGHVTIAGPIVAGEMDDVLMAILEVRGVMGIDNHLEPHGDYEQIVAP